MAGIQLRTEGSVPPPFPRIPLETTVGLTFAQWDDFFVESSANISQSGIFVKTGAPTVPGSVLMFEIWLEDFFKIVHGVGEVVWVRGVAEGPERPPGIGVRYLKIDRSSREMIQRVVDERLQRDDHVIDSTSQGDQDDESDGCKTAEIELADLETPEQGMPWALSGDELYDEPRDSLSGERANSRPMVVLRWHLNPLSIVVLRWFPWFVVAVIAAALTQLL